MPWDVVGWPESVLGFVNCVATHSYYLVLTENLKLLSSFEGFGDPGIQEQGAGGSRSSRDDESVLAATEVEAEGYAPGLLVLILFRNLSAGEDGWYSFT